MLYVNSVVEFDLAAIRELEENSLKALEMTADELLDEVKSSEVMPYDTGFLERENTFVDHAEAKNGRISIVSNTPYARRLYYHPEYNFHRGEWFDDYGDKHGGNIAAGGKWFEPWLPGGRRQDFCRDTFEILYRRLCGL